MTKQFYQSLDGVILVFSVTDEKSYDNLTRWLNQLLEIKPCPYLIAANKVDLEDDRVILEEQIEEATRKFQTYCVETSAQTGQNVEEAFNLLINAVVQLKLQKLKKEGKVIVPGQGMKTGINANSEENTTKESQRVTPPGSQKLKHQKSKKEKKKSKCC